MTKITVKLCFLLFLAIVMDITAADKNWSVCDPVTIDCVCGSGKSTKHVQLERWPVVARLLKNGKIKCSGYPNPYRVCAKISCSLASNNTRSVKKEKEFISNFYPQVFSIPGGADHAGHRFTRQGDPCHVTPLKNANIKCWKWPNWIKCDIKCIHGHALQMEGKSTTSTSINCRSTENNWTPIGFRDCQPYVNCQAQLIKPGELKCTQPINGPAYCDISCHAYEHYESVSHQRYECVDDSFSRILPHCAVLNEYVHLAEKPR